MDAEFKEEQIGTLIVRVGPMAGPREGLGGAEGSAPELTRAVKKNLYPLASAKKRNILVKTKMARKPAPPLSACL